MSTPFIATLNACASYDSGKRTAAVQSLFALYRQWGIRQRLGLKRYPRQQAGAAFAATGLL
jgi:hypothetical protein